MWCRIFLLLTPCCVGVGVYACVLGVFGGVGGIGGGVCVRGRGVGGGAGCGVGGAVGVGWGWVGVLSMVPYLALRYLLSIISFMLSAWNDKENQLVRYILLPLMCSIL